MEIDHIDRMLLSRLQYSTRVSAEVLGAEMGLSAASVQRRLKRLRETKIIAREVAVIEPKAVGLNMTFVVAVELERERIDILEAFQRKAIANENVQQCYYVTGDADFFLIIVARDMDDFEQLSRKLFMEDANVRRFRTSVVMNCAKTGTELAIAT